MKDVRNGGPSFYWCFFIGWESDLKTVQVRYRGRMDQTNLFIVKAVQIMLQIVILAPYRDPDSVFWNLNTFILVNLASEKCGFVHVLRHIDLNK